MPLQTRITRNDEALSLHWGWWHVSVMQDAAIRDANVEDFSETPLNKTGSQVLKNDYTYVDESDGEVLDLLVGDVLEMWR